MLSAGLPTAQATPSVRISMYTPDEVIPGHPLHAHAPLPAAAHDTRVRVPLRSCSPLPTESSSHPMSQCTAPPHRRRTAALPTTPRARSPLPALLAHPASGLASDRTTRPRLTRGARLHSSPHHVLPFPIAHPGLATRQPTPAYAPRESRGACRYTGSRQQRTLRAQLASCAIAHLSPGIVVYIRRDATLHRAPLDARSQREVQCIIGSGPAIQRNTCAVDFSTGTLPGAPLWSYTVPEREEKRRRGKSGVGGEEVDWDSGERSRSGGMRGAAEHGKGYEVEGEGWQGWEKKIKAEKRRTCHQIRLIDQQYTAHMRVGCAGSPSRMFSLFKLRGSRIRGVDSSLEIQGRWIA
ncbi:hypothetical protein B0H11DRAFT_2191088 [Mycena galericulata]|nr:hypothetical protein B0H11DRAFT_2191088 [Mycena galericulata]